jgi:hypothetical protein
MKSYRQQLANWVEEKKKTIQDVKQLELVNELQLKIKEMEDIEKWMVNRAYEKGYDDKELVRGRVGNYYGETYKLHDILKSLLN